MDILGLIHLLEIRSLKFIRFMTFFTYCLNPALNVVKISLFQTILQNFKMILHFFKSCFLFSKYFSLAKETQTKCGDSPCQSGTVSS